MKLKMGKNEREKRQGIHGGGFQTKRSFERCLAERVNPK